jgi:hypothetical protein
MAPAGNHCPTSPLYEVNDTEAGLTVLTGNSLSDAVDMLLRHQWVVVTVEVALPHYPHPLVVIFSISEVTCTAAVPHTVVIVKFWLSWGSCANHLNM